MKMLKKLLTLVLTVALTLSCMGEVKAAEVSEKEPYTYTITLYAGNRGTFNADIFYVDSDNDYTINASPDKVVISNLLSNDTISIYPQDGVDVTDDKYYVQGIRLSGRDNDELMGTYFRVEKDVDYVVAYGIAGNQVSYTVNYVDVDGNPLAESDVYYGNVGDKPVVAYRYIEGYVPEVVGFTKTLSDNAAENVFTFVYDEAPTPTIIIDYVGGGTTGGNQGGQDDQDDQDANAGQDNTDDVQGNEGQEEPGTPDGDDVQQGGDDTPDDTIQDLDDEQTPGGNIDVDNGNIGMIGGIGIAVAAALALFILILAMMKKRKQSE